LVYSGYLKGFFLSRKTVYRRVTTGRCFMRDMSPIVIVFYPKCRHFDVGIYHQFLIVNVLCYTSILIGVCCYCLES